MFLMVFRERNWGLRSWVYLKRKKRFGRVFWMFSWTAGESPGGREEGVRKWKKDWDIETTAAWRDGVWRKGIWILAFHLPIWCSSRDRLLDVGDALKHPNATFVPRWAQLYCFFAIISPEGSTSPVKPSSSISLKLLTSACKLVVSYHAAQLIISGHEDHGRGREPQRASGKVQKYHLLDTTSRDSRYG